MKPTRSTLTMRALTHMPKFALVKHTAAATRILHVPGSRLADTVNLALGKVRRQA